MSPSQRRRHSPAVSQDELKGYLEQDQVKCKTDTDMINWWREHKSKFPKKNQDLNTLASDATTTSALFPPTPLLTLYISPRALTL